MELSYHYHFLQTGRSGGVFHYQFQVLASNKTTSIRPKYKSRRDDLFVANTLTTMY